MSEVLRTARLSIREIEDDDVDRLHSIFGDAETMRYFPRVYPREEVVEFVRKHRAGYVANGFGLYALEELSTGEFVGDCGLAVQIIEGEPYVEIGWHVHRSRWREGIATEAATAMLDHGFATLGLRTIVALILPENEPSAGVARKVGMHVEREVEFKDLRHHLFVRRHDG